MSGKERYSRIDAFGITSVILLIFLTLLVVAVSADSIERTEERQRKEATERIRRGIEEYAQSIDISDLSIDPSDLGRIFSDAVKDTPYLFYVSNNLGYTYHKGGCVVTVTPKYTMEKEEAKEAVNYCKNEINKMAKLSEPCQSELERLIFAHDLICRKFMYDTTLESNNLYSFLKSGKGTCQGYTWTYMALLREMGIECRYVASDTVLHIWLAIKIDGEWYYSDVTWDDPPNKEGSGEYSRAHLLFSDEKADKDGYFDRYGAEDIRCESKIYDGRELSEKYPFCSLSGDVDHNGEVTLYDLLLSCLYLENKSTLSKDICFVCLDSDSDVRIDQRDAEYIRRAILEQ